MPQFLFDTDHLTLFQHKHAPLMKRMAQHPAGSVVICPINIEETMRGRLAPLGRVLSGSFHVQAYAHLAAAAALFQLFPMVPFDPSSESRFQQLRSARLRIGALDLKIGAIALTHNLTVLTCNRSDFGRIPGLSIEDWSV